MSSSHKFVIDTNIFIEAYKRYYSFDIAPSFWDALLQHAENGNIISIDRVKQEINSFHKNDELSEWANHHFAQWFEPTDKIEVFRTYQKLLLGLFSRGNILRRQKESLLVHQIVG